MEIKNNVLYGVNYNNIENGTFSIPSNVIEIGNFAFVFCASLKNITIPSSVMKIGRGAFVFCTSLKNITLPSGVTKIEDSTFEDCKSLQNIIIPNGIIEIGGRAFYNCESLENITLPSSVIKIGRDAFERCISLKNIILPDSVEYIGDGVFSNCESLQNIVFPSSLINIGNEVFEGCNSLQNIMVYGQKVNMNNFEKELNVVRQKELLDKIIFYLVSRGILDKRHYKYATHQEFINKTIKKYEDSKYYYENDFNKYMEEYINRNDLKKEDGQIDSNLKTLNDNVTNHNVKEFNPNGSISIINYGYELLENISKIEELISMIPTNYGPTNMFLEEELEKFKNPRNIIQYIESSKSDENVYLGKKSINLLMYCTAYNTYRLNLGIQKLSELEKALKIYIEKINHYKDNLLNYKVISIDTKDLHKNDDVLVQSKINKKVGSYDNHLILVTDLYKKLENLINYYKIYISKLENISLLLEKIKKGKQINKGIVNDKESVESLHEILDFYEGIEKTSVRKK